MYLIVDIKNVGNILNSDRDCLRRFPLKFIECFSTKFHQSYEVEHLQNTNTYIHLGTSKKTK